jgi:hypothetical protein
MIANIEQKYQEALQQAKRLGDGPRQSRGLPTTVGSSAAHRHFVATNA